MASPCIPVPQVAAPTLPFPFTLPTLPTPAAPSLNVCCQSLSIGALVPSVPLPPFVVNPAFVAGVRAMLGVVFTYINSLPVRCPRS